MSKLVKAISMMVLGLGICSLNTFIPEVFDITFVAVGIAMQCLALSDMLSLRFSSAHAV
jgi:hypothetical protein